MNDDQLELFARVKTRAEYISLKGFHSPKSMAARVRRTLNSTRAQLEKLSGAFDDVDQTVEHELNVLLSAFDEFDSHLMNTVEWLNETPEEW